MVGGRGDEKWVHNSDWEAGRSKYRWEAKIKIYFCEHGDELSGFIQGGEFLDEMSDNFSLSFLVHGVSYNNNDNNSLCR